MTASARTRNTISLKAIEFAFTYSPTEDCPFAYNANATAKLVGLMHIPTLELNLHASTHEASNMQMKAIIIQPQNCVCTCRQSNVSNISAQCKDSLRKMFEFLCTKVYVYFKQTISKYLVVNFTEYDNADLNTKFTVSLVASEFITIHFCSILTALNFQFSRSSIIY